MLSAIKNSLLLINISFYIAASSQNFDAELILQRTSIEIDNGRMSKYMYYEIKINNRSGEQFTKISIPYSNIVKVSKIEAYIHDSNGLFVKKLNKKEIIERSSISDFSFYEDHFVKEFTLKHNSYPYKLIYSFLIQQNQFLDIASWTPIISERIPTHAAELQLTIPFHYNIAYKNQSVDKPTMDTVKNSIRYEWKTNYSGLIRLEKYSPPISNFLPFVTIVPIQFTYDIDGSFSDWASYVNWQYNLLLDSDTLPYNEKIAVQSLINNIAEDKERIRILYHYLQDETRYLNVTIGTGGYKPYPASYVAQNKYGDCKALTNYFKAILDYIKIPSYYSKVYAGSPVKEIDMNFPSQQFNHIILYIPMEDDDIWLDCTSDGAFDYLGTFTQNRNALIISKEDGRFIKTPQLNPEDVLETRNIKIQYGSNLSKVEFSNTYRGDLYENLLHLERNFNESEKYSILSSYFVESGFQLHDYQISNHHRDSLMIEFSYHGSAPQIYMHYGNDILIRNISFTLPNFEKPQIRKLPVQIDYPLYKIDTISYQLPLTYKLNKNSDNFSIISKYGEYRYNIYDISDRVVVIKSVLIHAGYYCISEYNDFYNFYNDIFEKENKTYLSLYK